MENMKKKKTEKKTISRSKAAYGACLPLTYCSYCKYFIGDKHTSYCVCNEAKKFAERCGAQRVSTWVVRGTHLCERENMSKSGNYL